MIDVPVKLGPRSYRILVGAGLLSQAGPEISRLGVGRKLALITDPVIHGLHGEAVTRNLAGAFHQPRLVLADTGALQTLPEREYRSGLAEVIKHGIVLDAAYFDEVERSAAALAKREPETLERIVTGSCRLKASVIERDEQEAELRHVLNYGHTIGHAIEAVTGYARFAHGEAVSLGMVAEAGVAERLGLAATETRARQVRLLETMGLPVREVGEAPERVIEAMARDKKGKEGRVPFVLAPEIGRFRIVFDVPTPVILEALAELG